MKKIIFLTLLGLSPFYYSCENSSDSIDQSLLLKDFIEPSLNFLVTTEEIYLEIGNPDELIGIGYDYYTNNNGEKNRTYVFFDNKYWQSNVYFYANEPNVNFLLDWLTNKYGISAFYSGDGSSDTVCYVWTLATFEIQLCYSENLNRNDSILFVAYINKQ